MKKFEPNRLSMLHMLVSHLEDADIGNPFPPTLRSHADVLQEILKEIHLLLKASHQQAKMNNDSQRCYYLDQLFDTAVRITDWMNFRDEPNYRKKIRGKRLRRTWEHLSNVDLIDLCDNVKKVLRTNPEWAREGSLRLNPDVLLQQLKKRIEKGELMDRGSRIIPSRSISSLVFRARAVIAHIDHFVNSREEQDFLHAGWRNIRTLYDAVGSIKVVDSYKFLRYDNCGYL